MKINIDGRNYSFKFYHKNDQPATSKLSKKIEQTPLERATTCIVIYIPPTAITGSSRVGCNVAVYASYDDVTRHGYQVSSNIIKIFGTVDK